MPAPPTSKKAGENSRVQDLLRRRKAAGTGAAVPVRQESTASGGHQSSVLAGWRELLPGDSVVLLPSSGEAAVAGVVDVVSADGSVIWIFQDDCSGRRLFHHTDIYETLLDIGARAQKPNS